MALAAQRCGPFEVVVVDDGSNDGTSARLSQLAAEVPFALRILRLPHSRGPAYARNRGWQAARAPLIAFTDDDCEPKPDWLASLLQALSAAGPDVAGIGGRVEPATSGVISRYMTYHRILEPPPSLAYLVTANCLYRRAALTEIGGFDESIRTPGGEDPGLSFALRERGYRLGFAPGAVVSHHYRESVRDFVRTFFRYGKGCRCVVDG
jgi:GT2 family glycosyltransferase